MPIGVSIAVSTTVGGGFVFQPPQLSGNVLWLRADLGITVTGAGVSTWADQSGNGNDATQGTDADRPAYSTSGWGSLPTVDFDVANTEMLDLASNLGAPNDFTVVAVLDALSLDTAGPAVLGPSNSGVALTYSRTGSVGMFDGAAWRTAGTAATGQQWLAVAADAAGTSADIYIDGTSVGPVTYDGTMGWLANPGVGALPGGTNFADMRLAELVVYDEYKSASDIARIGAYISARYGL